MLHKSFQLPHLHLSLHHTWNPEILEYYIYVVLRNTSIYLSTLFLPVYLYTEVGYSLVQVFLFFIINQLYFLAFIPFAGNIIQKIGVKHTLALHLPFISLFWFLLRFLSGDFFSDLGFIILILAIRAIPKSCMETAERLFVSEHIIKEKAYGKGLATIQIMIIISTIVAPIAGGFIAFYFGFNMFFNFAILLTLAAAVPLIISKDEYYKMNFKRNELFNFLEHKMPKPLMQAEFGRVFPDSILWLAWPLFLFIIVQSTLDMGLLIGLAAAIAIVVAKLIGNFIDTKESSKLLKNSTRLASVIFFTRTLFPYPIMLVITDAVNKIVSPALLVPYQKYVYEYIHKSSNKLEVVIAMSLWVETIYTFGFIICALYFIMLSLLEIEVTFISFSILFLVFGCFLLLMSRVVDLEKHYKHN